MDLFDGCTDKTLANGLTWLNEPPDWSFDDTGLTVTPKAKTDFFRPYREMPKDNAGLLYVQVSGDFTAETKAQAALSAFGDAAALTVRENEVRWAKLCLERSPIGDISVVSVVTDQWSDDSNGELLDHPECCLRLTRRGNLFGMHYSLDGTAWRFVRAFGLEFPDTVMVGVHAQAPFRGGCRAIFKSLHITSEPVSDFRSGE